MNGNLCEVVGWVGCEDFEDLSERAGTDSDKVGNRSMQLMIP